EISSTTSCSTSSRANSVQSHRLSERPSSSGIWQAIRTNSMATEGGKDRGTPGTGHVLQPANALLAVTVEPVADDLAVHVHGPRDRSQAHAVRGEQHDTSPTSLSGRGRRAARKMEKLGALLRAEMNRAEAREGHRSPPAPSRKRISCQGR